jgi:hypothetical protein
MNRGPQVKLHLELRGTRGGMSQAVFLKFEFAGVAEGVEEKLELGGRRRERRN